MESGALAPASTSEWRPVQAYGLAVICLLIGLPVGYLLHGPVAATPATAAAMTAPPGNQAATPDAAAPQAEAPAPPQQMPSLDQMKHMADKQAQPVLDKLKKDPNNPALLHEAAKVYRAAHRFQEAADYYAKALKGDPKNIAMRADYATCLYFTGNVDAALAQLDKALTYEPNHPGILMNIGIIKWEGKHDGTGAVAAWEQLLKSNPNYDRRDNVQHLIDKVKQQSAANTPPPSKG